MVVALNPSAAILSMIARKSSGFPRLSFSASLYSIHTVSWPGVSITPSFMWYVLRPRRLNAVLRLDVPVPTGASGNDLHWLRTEDCFLLWGRNVLLSRASVLISSGVCCTARTSSAALSKDADMMTTESELASEVPRYRISSMINHTPFLEFHYTPLQVFAHVRPPPASPRRINLLSLGPLARIRRAPSLCCTALCVLRHSRCADPARHTTPTVCALTHALRQCYYTMLRRAPSVYSTLASATHNPVSYLATQQRGTADHSRWACVRTRAQDA